MARPRKPKELQTGHLTVIDGQMKKAAEDAVKTEKNQLKTPPKWLINDVAKKEWRRLIKELDKLNIVGTWIRTTWEGTVMRLQIISKRQRFWHSRHSMWRERPGPALS